MLIEGNIDLLTTDKLLGMKFRIPSYQRGYRWRGPQHVKTLLKDLDLFKSELDNAPDSPRVYSLQPLVVKRTVPPSTCDELLNALRDTQTTDCVEKAERLFESYWEWEVIDGQQRLTTLFLTLTYLKAPRLYTITYDTRTKSQEFLKKFAGDVAGLEVDSKTNIDFSRMYEAYTTIQSWFADKDETYRKDFCKLILERVQFIWYESVGEPAIEVFTRLNIGNIKLTDAELVKALVLNQDSFADLGDLRFSDAARLKLARGKIAAEWDMIERRLQDDAFWLYIQPYDPKAKDPPTRVDFLLRLVAKNLRMELDANEVHDEHDLFHRYERFFRLHKGSAKDRSEARKCVWGKITETYRVLEEWFEDSKLYHYTGYLMALKNVGRKTVDDLLDEWFSKGQNRESFTLRLEELIKASLSRIRDRATHSTGDVKSILDVVYDEPGCLAKVECTPLLLLHNVITIIRQGETMSRNELYRGQRVYYKFPFNLYKREDWEIEHVDPRTQNELEKSKDQKEWLLGAYPFVSDALRQRIVNFCNHNGGDGENEDFSDLRDACVKSQDITHDALKEHEKNMIWNFVLLDGGTNAGYGNSLFPAKRRTIMFKEQGIKLKDPILEDDGHNNFRVKWTEEKSKTPFVPPCTKHVFLQYYSSAAAAPLVWSRSDAESYRQNLQETLKQFL